MAATDRHRHRGGTDRSTVLGPVGFVAEIALFAGVGIAAFRLVGEGPGGVVIAATAVVATVIVWAVLMAAGSSHRLGTVGRLALVLLVGGGATAVLAATDSAPWPLVTGVATALLLAVTAWSGTSAGPSHVGRHTRSR